MCKAILWQAFAAASFFFKFSYAQDSSPTGPTHPNIDPNCNAFHTIVDGDGCWSVETQYSISHADFIKWNPDVLDDCLTNFWLGSSYCVGVGAVANSRSTSGLPVTSSSGVLSSSISSSISASISNSVSNSISVTSQVSSATSSGKSPPVTANATYSVREPIITWNISSSTVESAFPPKKTQAGQPSYCNNWHLVTAGESCQEIVGSATWATMAQL